MRRECRHTAHDTGLNGSRHGTVGQALTELALVLPLLALISIGVLDIGRAYHTYVTLANAARVGVLYAQEVETPKTEDGCSAAASSGTTSTSIPDCTHIHVSDVINKTISEAQGGISLTPANVAVCLENQPTCPVTDTSLPIVPNELITVTVTLPFQPITPFVHAQALSGSVTGRTFIY